MPPRVTPERLDDATRQVKAYYQELSASLVSRGMKALPDIRLYVSKRMRRNYGYCAFRRKGTEFTVEKIAISWMAFRKGPSMWKDVVAHEAAHAYCIAYHQRPDHSPSWRHVARLLGSTAQRVGCEDPLVRQHAKEKAEEHPTVLTVLTRRDQAAVRLSLRAQQKRHGEAIRAIEATIIRFPQFCPQRLREFLFRECGLTLGRKGQLALPF